MNTFQKGRKAWRAGDRALAHSFWATPQYLTLPF
ncbi:hypothetical protein PgNI_05655 [Pyricularia grisea]|uniref:Uncharacterized protein n=1 Tax=Pyricularia grisea TaxID=148305 RepID=A0A6P8B4B2_PYRGI|nr:hypothetical protein PgNI_05655 [Pyricularia grisea]TLD10137.1 hypothetical protein PgNI_05655 [Pyricularia grisea]